MALSPRRPRRVDARRIVFPPQASAHLGTIIPTEQRASDRRNARTRRDEPEYATYTRTQILRYVAGYDDQFEEGHVARVDPTSLHWVYEAAYPIELFGYTFESWAKWIIAEHKLAQNDGRIGYADEMTNPIREPIVVVEIDAVGYPWDGNHRIGGACKQGQSTIGAFVGRPAKGPA